MVCILKPKRRTIDEIDMIGAETAAITHGHELGYIPAAGLVHIVQSLSHNEDISLLDAVLDMKEALRRQFTNRKHLSEQIDLIDKAIALSKENIDDLEAIRELGQGWVAEETLAIAIYCSLKYSDDFDKAIIASVNHSGDSDSTGAVTGNILGAYLGLKSIPKKYLDNLELKMLFWRLPMTFTMIARFQSTGHITMRYGNRNIFTSRTDPKGKREKERSVNG